EGISRDCEAAARLRKLSASLCVNKNSESTPNISLGLGPTTVINLNLTDQHGGGELEANCD
ncbi:MAG: hypothetical protein ACRD1T_08000, partial [Acidimicrobiia bacterium]